MRITVKRNIIAALGATALILTTAAGAPAQQVPGRSAAAPEVGAPQSPAALPDRGNAPERARAEWVLSPDQDQVRVPLNKVVSVRLPAPVRNVVVANPDIADVILPQDGSKNHVFVLARQVGATSIVFEDGQGDILFQGDIQVDVDVDGIQAAIKEMLPDDKIEVVAHRNSVFLKGFVRTATASNTAVNITRRFVTDPIEVVNNLEILGSQQVVMQVRIAEIKRTVLKGLSVDVGFGRNEFTNTGITGTTNSTAMNQTIAGRNPFLNDLTTTIGRIPGLTTVTIDALEDQGFAKTLAEPTLTAMSGEAATFTVGGKFPMPTLDDNGNLVADNLEPYGIRLDFTPVVLDKGNINLQVYTEVSDVDFSVAVSGIPGKTENSTQTTVELPSGGSMFISGLIQNDMSNAVEGVPGLKDIPILGNLFRSESFKNEETELVIILTAYLAEPTSNADKLSLPTDGFAPASDLDFYLLGRLHKVYTEQDLSPYATPLTGPYGYIME